MTPGYEEMKAQGSFGKATEPERTSAEEKGRERFFAARDWCKRNVPDEHPELAASSVLTLRLSGRWPTADQVRARLRAQGRDMASLKAKGTFEECP